MTGAGQESLSPWSGHWLGQMRTQTSAEWPREVARLSGKAPDQGPGALKQCDCPDLGSIHGGRLTGLEGAGV